MAASNWSDIVRELRLPETPDAILQASLRIKATGQLHDALAGLEEVLRRDPHHITALREIAGIQRQLGRRKDAETTDLIRTGVEADQLFLRSLQHAEDEPEVARRYLQACATLAPEHDGLAFASALLDDAPCPDSIPDPIIAMLNDRQAARYDWHSRTVWHRHAPTLLHRAVLAATLGEISEFVIADIGCGTGLGAEPFGTIVSRIDGVDLSPAMLERAFRRRLHDDSTMPLYAELELGPLKDWLASRSASYDLVLASDALVSTSDLVDTFAAAAQALRPSGLFAFSYEVSNRPGPSLSPQHGFRHNPFAIRRALAAAGLQVQKHSHAALRHDGHATVHGDIVIATRQSPA